MNPLDRIIQESNAVALCVKLPRILAASVCSGRIHDRGASTVAEVNAMYTESENDGSYQHTPIIRGGQGRSDAEMSEWGETLHAVCKWLVIAAALVSLALIAVGVL